LTLTIIPVGRGSISRVLNSLRFPADIIGVVMAPVIGDIKVESLYVWTHNDLPSSYPETAECAEIADPASIRRFCPELFSYPKYIIFP
jgi:hypothetical protein